MASSPTQRTLKHMRGMGFTCAITEHWNPFAKIRQDLYGFCDVLAIRPGEGIIAVQTTSATNFSARAKKILDSDNARAWVESGGRIRVHGWKKTGRFWQVRDEEITHDRFAGRQAATDS